MKNETETKYVYHDDEFLTQKELAERLNKSVRTIQNWRHQGLLPFKRMGNSIFFHWAKVKNAMSGGWDEPKKEARKELQFQASQKKNKKQFLFKFK